MLNITIHGIGNPQANYATAWSVEHQLAQWKVPANTVYFHYEDFLENSNLNVLGKVITKGAMATFAPALAKAADIPVGLAEDYIFDILVMALDVRTREAIGGAFKTLLDSYSMEDEINLWAHSQGTLFIWWFIKKYPQYAPKLNVVMMGSPWGSKILSGLVRWAYKSFTKSVSDFEQSGAKAVFNVWSELDPISGPIVDMGIKANTRIDWKQKTFHQNVMRYIHYFLEDRKPNGKIL